MLTRFKILMKSRNQIHQWTTGQFLDDHPQRRSKGVWGKKMNVFQEQEQDWQNLKGAFILQNS